MARPTKYSSTILSKAEDYLQGFVLPNNLIPYVEELALLLEVNDDTLVEWAKEHKEFSATLKKLKMIQRLRLYNATMQRDRATGAIFQLKVNHGKIEVNRNELTGKDGKDLPTPIYAGRSTEN